jgi:AcrR family transcriptional regulator
LASGKRSVGRPSVADERIEEILDAYTRCVARYGLDGTTLQQVADEAGMARGHIRHYVGNRDELRRIFGKRLFARYAGQGQNVATDAASGKKAETLVRHFFRAGNAPNDDYAAIDALFAAARFDENLRKRLRTVYTGLESLVSSALADDYPGREPMVYEDAAYQIVALAYGHWSFSELDFPVARVQSALRGALAVIDRVARAQALATRR